ncbi:hypothetical protein PENTCL1PPCAC_10146, partial [Pristionchus entomophagus]
MRRTTPPMSPGLVLLESELFAFIEQIRLRTAQVHDLRTAIAILLHDGALLAVVCIGDARATADHASALVRSVVALVADSHERARTHVRVADDAATIALVAQSADGDARLLATEDEIGMVLGHPLPTKD